MSIDLQQVEIQLERMLMWAHALLGMSHDYKVLCESELFDSAFRECAKANMKQVESLYAEMATRFPDLPSLDDMLVCAEIQDEEP
ncbi:hypothetical protein [Bowmanella pacifica]|uniref:Uncharacterized protein n=1 Tax=Bowmanella pacifica TaxID=502051 RepID=A0A917YXE2_9ALTE|nr:hypothetical protein [Bowmanella pacifica]GGO69583.1 hypothetical protein GCM10010982_21090 [Bowmanella pacifica]